MRSMFRLRHLPRLFNVCLWAATLFSCLPLAWGEEERVLYQDSFEEDLSQWVVEQMPGGMVSLKDGKLEIVDAKGCTIWFKNRISGPVKISFDAILVSEGGEFDRVSDLNCFWMATDPKSPDDLFAGEKRTGKFSDYYPLQLYYVGYGANNNTTTRFRRYPGDGTRPCLPGHDLREAKFMHRANQVIRIEIISDGRKIQYLRDGELVFDWVDAAPLTSGWFGFRTVRNHLRIDNFQVTRLPSKK